MTILSEFPPGITLSDKGSSLFLKYQTSQRVTQVIFLSISLVSLTLVTLSDGLSHTLHLRMTLTISCWDLELHNSQNVSVHIFYVVQDAALQNGLF